MSHSSRSINSETAWPWKQAVVTVIIVLIASWLALDPPMAPQQPAPAGHPPELPSKGKSRVGPAVKLRGLPKVDRGQFLEVFERQTKSVLIPCLLNEGLSTGSETFLARLHKSGRLTAVRTLPGRQPLPDCAKKAVEVMRFDTVARGINGDSIEIEWRVDW